MLGHRLQVSFQSSFSKKALLKQFLFRIYYSHDEQKQRKEKKKKAAIYPEGLELSLNFFTLASKRTNEPMSKQH